MDLNFYKFSLKYQLIYTINSVNSNMINTHTKKSHTRHIIVKLLKIKDKEKES